MRDAKQNQALPADDEAEGKKPVKPQDPRKSPLVVLSLQRAARRDPSIDPFKPVGRSSFLVWAFVLSVMVLGGAFAADFVNFAFVTDTIWPTVKDYLRSERSRALVIREINAHMHSEVIWGVTIFASASFVLGLYYAAVYLVFVHVRDGLFDMARAMAMASSRLARRVGRASVKGAKAASARVRAALPSPHGREPKFN